MKTQHHNRTMSFVLSFFVLAGVFGVPVLHAQESIPYRMESLPTNEVFSDFVVGPGKIELTINPGESKTVELTLANRMGDDRVFDIVVEDIEGSDNPEQTVVLLGDDRGPYSLRDYFEFPSESFMLPHGKKARVPVTVHAPENAEPGGYYGTVLFTTATKKGEDDSKSAAAIVSRIGVLFFVTVPGDIAYEGSLESFTTKQNIFMQGPIPFQLFFRNSGNMHMTPSGEITIKNMIGTPVEVLPIEPWFVLPKSLRLREVEWDRPALAGRYTVTADIKRGYGEEHDVRTITFWVIPWKPVVGGLALLFVLLFIIRFFANRFEFRRKGK